MCVFFWFFWFFFCHFADAIFRELKRRRQLIDKLRHKQYCSSPPCKLFLLLLSLFLCNWKVFCFSTHTWPRWFKNPNTHTSTPASDILHFIWQTRVEIRVAGNHRIHRRQYVCLPVVVRLTAVDMRAFWNATMSCTACLRTSLPHPRSFQLRVI